MCANIEAQTIAGRKPLHFAAGFIGVSNEPAKTLEILIQKGAKLDVKDFQNDTPLHLAVLQKRSCRIEILVRYGASLTIRNNYGLTPLECALQASAANMELKLKCLKGLCYKVE